jgi:WD40 repeat protein
MFTNRSFHLFIVTALLVVTACAPQIALTNTAFPPTTAVPPPTFTPSPTAVPPTPTLTSTATLFEGRLLFSRFNEASHTFTGMFVAQTDGSAETEVPLPWTEGDGNWSMSGTEIAVPTLLADGRVGTAIIATDGTVLRVLSIPDATLNLPCTFWSHDDTRLACEGWDDTDSSRNGIYTVLAADGGDIQRLTTPPTGKHDLPGDYSPAGQFVFLRATGDEGPGPLLLIDANGSEPRLLYNGPVEDAGRFSPDGRLITTSTNGSLLVIGLDGQVVHRISIDGYFAFGPDWSPDGTRIAFSLTIPGVYAAEIYTSLPDGTDRQRVTNTAANEINVEWGVGSE